MMELYAADCARQTIQTCVDAEVDVRETLYRSRAKALQKIGDVSFAPSGM